MKYKDKLFRLIACLLAAHFMVMLGKEISSIEAFMIWTYYPTLAINYCIALILAMVVRKVTMTLDRHHAWYADTWRRAMLQLVFGVVAVAILCFFLVWLYFAVFSQDIMESGYLDYEFPFAIALITILNLYYVAYYFYYTPPPDKVLDVIPLSNEITDDIQTRNTLSERSVTVDEPAQSTENSTECKVKREVLIVDTPLRSIPVKIAEVAMFFIYEKTVFVATKEMKHFNECYSLSGYLSEVSDWLDEREFFRINRQCIVNFDVIASFESHGEKSLLIKLKSDLAGFIPTQEEMPVKICTVSVDRVCAFKEWMNR